MRTLSKELGWKAELPNGAQGNDTLDGGTGMDQFVFDTTLNAATNVDTIQGFVVADDTIRMENAVFTVLAAPGTLAAGQFVVGASALDADDFVIYDSASGDLFYDADGALSGVSQIRFAHVDPGLLLTNNDFLNI